tara:strand:- start:277 stop:450 length:174 start_codon:yes stop_codon:yes gene_type:complete
MEQDTDHQEQTAFLVLAASVVMAVTALFWIETQTCALKQRQWSIRHLAQSQARGFTT